MYRVNGELFMWQSWPTPYMLHAIQNKSQKTNRNDIELARKRFKEIGDK